MNSIERSTIEKAGYAHGFENVRESVPQRVTLYSARHRAEAWVEAVDGEAADVWHLRFPETPPPSELLRSFPGIERIDDAYLVTGEAELGKLLRRAAELAKSLPDQAARNYEAEVQKIDADKIERTEVLALVKQRRGQALFREALLDYWGGACAVTGIETAELLRASHAKPWADCVSDSERLNVFNGFLLCAHLDALFDRGLMTFSKDGQAVFAARLQPEVRAQLNLQETMRFRWLSPEHAQFLDWHRSEVFLGS